MKNGRRISFIGIWRGAYPVLLYELMQILASVLYAVYLILPAILKGTAWDELPYSLWQEYTKGTVMIVLIGAMIALPLFGWLYHQDTQKQIRTGWQEHDPSPSEGQLLWVVIGSAALALFANNIISLTPLMYWSDSYEQTSEALYMGSIWLRMACIGFFAPAVEEYMMRGLFYQRFREMMGPGMAMFWSALVFGLIHGNIVQGVYAFLIGLFFTWLMERFQKIIAPILAHMSANLFVLLLQDNDDLSELVYGSILQFFVWTLTGGAVFLAAFWILKKQEN